MSTGMRRWRAAPVVAVVLTAAGWWAGAGGARAAPSAARVARVGWWTQQPGAQAQPAGGFQIAYGPQGPQSEAAVEVTVDPSAGPVNLVLDEGASVGDNLAAVDACAIRGSWRAANPGAWGEAPVYDCSSKAALTRDPATSTWHADVSSLAPPGGSTSLMLVPVAQAVGGGVSPAFQLTFTAATASAPPGAAPGGASSSGSSGYLAPADSSTSPQAAAPPADAPPALPSLPLAANPAPPPVTPPVPANPPASTGAGAFVATPTQSGAPADHSGGRPWWRLAALVPLSGLVGAGGIEARRRLAPAS